MIEESLLGYNFEIPLDGSIIEHHETMPDATGPIIEESLLGYNFEIPLNGSNIEHHETMPDATGPIIEESVLGNNFEVPLNGSASEVDFWCGHIEGGAFQSGDGFELPQVIS
jgi:hypothetical protein